MGLLQNFQHRARRPGRNRKALQNPAGLKSALSAKVVCGIGRVRRQAVALGGVEDGRAVAVHQAALAAHLHGSSMIVTC